MTMCEKILWAELKGKKMMGFDFDRQRPIDHYIVDFYCKDLMLAIEVDGINHSNEEAKQRDELIQKKLESLGVRFLRFEDDEIKMDINGVLDIIKEWIRSHPELVGREGAGHPPPSPSKEGGLTGTGETNFPKGNFTEGNLIHTQQENSLKESDLIKTKSESHPPPSPSMEGGLTGTGETNFSEGKRFHTKQKENALTKTDLIKTKSESHPPPSPSKEGGLVRTPHEGLSLGRDLKVGNLGGDLEVGHTRRKKDTKFHFKQFSVRHDHSGMKVGTDGTLLGAWTDVKNAKYILDIGTGTGLIALMLAQRTRDSKIEAIEIDAAAIGDAQENFAQSPWKDRLILHHARAQDFKPSEKFDLIVSNPPYFIDSYKPPSEQRITARHAENLTFQELIDTSQSLLTADGKLSVILPAVEGTHLIDLAVKNDLFLSRKWTFRTRPEKPIERLLLEFARKGTAFEEGEILLYSSGEEWSESYKALTKEFYLKL